MDSSTTAIGLELEYREPCISREVGTDPNGPEKVEQNFNADGGCLKMSLYAS